MLKSYLVLWMLDVEEDHVYKKIEDDFTSAVAFVGSHEGIERIEFISETIPYFVVHGEYEDEIAVIDEIKKQLEKLHAKRLQHYQADKKIAEEYYETATLAGLPCSQYQKGDIDRGLRYTVMRLDDSWRELTSEEKRARLSMGY